MKKKYSASSKDKKDWFAFTENLENVYNKEVDLVKQNITPNKIKKLDLHGLSLNQANRVTKKFIVESFEDGYKKILVITGKGSRSKVYENPYLSDKMQVLRYSVPEFIKNDEDLADKISALSTTGLKDGGKGSFYIFLKKKKKL